MRPSNMLPIAIIAPWFCIIEDHGKIVMLLAASYSNMAYFRSGVLGFAPLKVVIVHVFVEMTCFHVVHVPNQRMMFTVDSFVCHTWVVRVDYISGALNILPKFLLV